MKQKTKRNTNQIDPRGLDDNGEFLSGLALIDRVRELAGDTILLSFSCGKDSLAMWLYLREHFNIIPYHLWWIPDMAYVNVSLDYYEDYFQTRIYRMAHPIFYKMLATGSFQSPGRLAAIAGLELPQFDLPDVDVVLAAHLGLTDPLPFCAVGMRMGDNLLRRTLMQQQGVLGFKRRRYYYAIWDWNVAQVSEIINRHGVKLAPEYGIIGRTIGSFQYQELADLRRAFPADFEKLRQWFPLIDLEFFRYEQVGQSTAANN
jgi:hypothetical protein